MEIIIDNTSTSQRNLIPTTNPRNANKANLHSSILPPGQVTSTHRLNGNYANYNAVTGVGGVETNMAKRQTQGIAAIAAQRKAYQHHRELMQELGQNNNNGYSQQPLTLTDSRLAKHDQLSNQYDDLFEKKNSVLTDNSLVANKTKKQVKIRDIVQYKLPDEEPVSHYFCLRFIFLSRLRIAYRVEIIGSWFCLIGKII